jgi:hypothetical protein
VPTRLLTPPLYGLRVDLDHLEARLAEFLRDGGSDPASPRPTVAWHAVLRLGDVAAGIEDLGDDFLRFEAVVLPSDEGVEVSISREISECEGHQHGAVGCSFNVATAQDPSLHAMIESLTEPEYLAREEFVAQVEATRAFQLLLSGPAHHGRCWSFVSEG